MGGGTALFAGANYQKGTIAYIFAHVLTHRPLGWLTPLDDTPLAVTAETSGPGDDVRVEFGPGSCFEIQAKSGLRGPVALDGAVRDIFSRTGDRPFPVVLVVDRRSSGWIYREFATELERIRKGRLELIHKARDLHEALGGALAELRVKALDVSPPDEVDGKSAKDLLATILVQPNDVPAAWALLLQSGADVAERRLRMDRADLVELLREQNIDVRSLPQDEPWLAQLEFAAQLRKRYYAAAALSALDRLSDETRNQSISVDVQYGLARQRAAALLQLGRSVDALIVAKQALDVRPSGTGALVTAATAALDLGDLGAARDYADNAIQSAPLDPRAWATAAHVCAVREVDLPATPSAVATSELYRTTLVEILLGRRDSEQALELTGRMLQDGQRSPEVLYLHAIARLESTRDPVTGECLRDDEVERFSSEAILGFEDVHPLKPRALIVRAAAKQAAGKVIEAEEDLRLAESLDPGDAETLRNRALFCWETQGYQAALDLLAHPMTSSDAGLLSLRAKLRARGDGQRREEAVKDLEQAISLMSDAPNPDLVREAVADVALDLDLPEVAARALDGLTEAALDGLAGGLLMARLAFARGDIVRGVEIYYDAAERAGPDQDGILVELAVSLCIVGRYSDTVDIFDQLPPSFLTAEARRAYVHALMRIGDLARAQEQIDVLAGSQPLPAWALSIAVNVALMREDIDVAIAHLTELANGKHANPEGRIILAHLLLEEDQPRAATTQVEALKADPKLTAVERMQLANLLHELGRDAEASLQALWAYREGRNDPQLHRALAGMMLVDQVDLPSTDVVGPDTFVRLRDEYGGERSHVILSRPPYDPSRSEIDVIDAETMGLLGKSVGDFVINNEGWQQETWRVETITPAVVYFAIDAAERYRQRFPGEPLFIVPIHVGDGTKPSDYVRLIQALAERRKGVEHVLRVQREQIVPLGMVEPIANVPLVEVMDGVRVDPDQFGPLWVEWDDGSLLAWSAEQARVAHTIVLTRSALKTIFDLDLADIVNVASELVAPRSLIADLRKEVSNAGTHVERGRKAISSGGIGIQVDELEPGHPILVQQLEKLKAVLTWVMAHVRVEPRPLDWIKPEDVAPTSFRQVIGASSYDALVLTAHLGAILYTDDLGLRRVALGDARSPSFSSITLLPALAERGLLDAAARDHLLSTLAVRGYMSVPPSPGLLLAALKATPSLNGAELARVFGSLTRQTVTPREAAKIAARACRVVALDTVQVVSPAKVATLSLTALANRIPRPAASALLEEEAASLLQLLPHHFDAVRRVCVQFARR